MEVAREYLESSLDAALRESSRHTPDVSEETVPPQSLQLTPTVQSSPKSSSSYTLASEQSVFSRDVDHWMRGDVTSTETGIQGSRAAFVQRSTLTATVSNPGLGLWYLLAMLLPLFNVNSTARWRCSPSAILNTAEVFLYHVGRAVSHIRCHIRRLAQNQMSRDLFATAMDVVLIVYAIGFLILSMYQASVIG